MGTKNDIKRRTNNPREDSGFLASRIAMVRSWIFKDGVAPEGVKIKQTMLDKTSTTTTQVCSQHEHYCDL